MAKTKYNEKNIMIRFRQIFVTVCSILAAFGLQAQEFGADGLRFYLDEDGNATVGARIAYAQNLKGT